MPTKKTTKKIQPKRSSKKANQQSPEEILKELKNIGSLVKENVLKAWKSEQKENAEKQIASTLESFIKGVDDLIAQAKQKDIKTKMKTQLYQNLKKISKKLDEKSKQWKVK